MNYRICIFGNSGSGKSTLAKALSKALRVPVFHLDRELLTGNYKKLPEADRISKHRKIINKPAWIIDGNFRELLLKDRLERANLVIFLNSSRFRTIPRVLFRAKKGGQDTETIPSDAKPQNLDLNFLKWVALYNRRKHLRELKQLCKQKGIRILVLENNSSDKMVGEVVRSIKNIFTI